MTVGIVGVKPSMATGDHAGRSFEKKERPAFFIRQAFLPDNCFDIDSRTNRERRFGRSLTLPKKQTMSG
jgi:hypothetical protein